MIVEGGYIIAETNTPEAIAPRYVKGQARIWADDDNTATVYIGGQENRDVFGNGVLTTGPVSSGLKKGAPIRPGEGLGFLIEISQVYIAGNAGDLVTWVIVH